jgi:hypothetical protein
MIILSKKWLDYLSDKPESGMGYQIVSIVLKDGRRFDQVVIVEGYVTQVRGFSDIPFVEDDVHEIVLTHDKWDFNAN